MRLAELCAGYGGLTLGVAAAGWPVEMAWYAETDRSASAVMAHHHPGVPNLGDITAIDWTTVPPVDILTAGFPCQPFSLAGRRKGLDDDRWIWPDVAAAIRDLRPAYAFLENVPGLLVGGMGDVVADLASIRYVGSWCCVRASDVGAAHRRERVFILARPADAESVGHGHTGSPGKRRLPATPLAGDSRKSGGVDLLPTPTARDGDGRGEGDQAYWTARVEHRSNGLPLAAAVTLLPTPRTSDANGGGMHGRGGLDLRTATALLPTPRATDGTKGGPNQRGSSGDLMLSSAVQADRWCTYASTIAGWERTTGRPAPDPTEIGLRGGQRLAPRFVEWLMGLPAGHVTDHVDRNAALRILGNGVVPQQAARALNLLEGLVGT